MMKPMDFSTDDLDLLLEGCALAEKSDQMYMIRGAVLSNLIKEIKAWRHFNIDEEFNSASGCIIDKFDLYEDCDERT